MKYVYEPQKRIYSIDKFSRFSVNFFIGLIQWIEEATFFYICVNLLFKPIDFIKELFADVEM